MDFSAFDREHRQSLDRYLGHAHVVVAGCPWGRRIRVQSTYRRALLLFMLSVELINMTFFFFLVPQNCIINLSAYNQLIAVPYLINPHDELRFLREVTYNCQSHSENLWANQDCIYVYQCVHHKESTSYIAVPDHVRRFWGVNMELIWTFLLSTESIDNSRLKMLRLKMLRLHLILKVDALW